MTAKVPPRVKPRSRRQPKPAPPKILPPYHVVLLNDEHHTFAYVIDLLQRVFGHPADKAFKLTEQIHRQGKAAVWTGQKEVAEFKADRVRGFGPDFFADTTVKFPLGVVIEPAAS